MTVNQSNTTQNQNAATYVVVVANRLISEPAQFVTSEGKLNGNIQYLTRAQAREQLVAYSVLRKPFAFKIVNQQWLATQTNDDMTSTLSKLGRVGEAVTVEGLRSKVDFNIVEGNTFLSANSYDRVMASTAQANVTLTPRNGSTNYELSDYLENAQEAVRRLNTVYRLNVRLVLR